MDSVIFTPVQLARHGCGKGSLLTWHIICRGRVLGAQDHSHHVCRRDDRHGDYRYDNKVKSRCHHALAGAAGPGAPGSSRATHAAYQSRRSASA